MTKNNNTNNIWTPKDEREHPRSVLEWWCIEAFFKSIEDKKRWSLKGALNEWFMEKKETGSTFSLTLFDLDKNKHFIGYSRNESTKLKSAKDSFYVRYNDSFMKGLYPNYKMYFNDKKNNIKFNINYHAEAKPRWIAQDITDGQLPLGLGFYRYGFIPKGNVSGTMQINDKTYHLEGKGYFEHAWGDFWYDDPFKNFSGLKKTISTYFKLFGWWLHNHKISIPKSITLSTENNPFGYDWVWALLDNGWTIFYGNIMFWMMNGPVAGTLIFSKDGKTYTEFGNVYFHYNKIQYSKKYDFYYPTEIEVAAKHGKEKLHLQFKMTTECREYVSRFRDGKYWVGFVICEAPGEVKGFYYDGEEKKRLKGLCKMEPQRQVSIIGHNSLKINFIKPPNGVGISFELDSNYLKKKMYTKIQLAPSPKIKMNIKKIDNPRRNINQYSSIK